MGAKVTDEVVWTDAGRAELAREYTWTGPLLRDAPVAELKERLATSLARFRPCWQRGLATSDDTGRPLIELALTDFAITKLTVEQAAGISSLLGARSENHDSPFIELLMRERGLAFVVRVAAAAWSLVTDYDDPDWPENEKRLAISLRAIDGESSSANDTSVSHGKGQLADYLGKVHHTATKAQRKEIEATVDEIWDDVPLYARPALALAAQSSERATEIVDTLLAAKRNWHPHFAFKHLALFIDDPKLLDAIDFTKNGMITLRWLERRGVRLLPMLAKRCAKAPPHMRARLMEVLANIRGTTAANLVAGFIGKKDVKAQVTAYFERYPDLAPVTARASAPRGAGKPRSSAPRTKSRSRPR
jgi:hypothetical protein